MKSPYKVVEELSAKRREEGYRYFIHGRADGGDIMVEKKSKWCQCNNVWVNPEDWSFHEGGSCPCEIGKEHYHCPACGGVKQVG